MLGIQNRRYLGNKYKLLDFIDETINKHCPGVNSILDIFAGTGVVAYHFMDKMKVVTNDILYSNYLSHVAFMSDEKFDSLKIKETIEMFNSLNPETLNENYMSITFGDTYFSRPDCKKIGFARECIENSYEKGILNFREKAILVTTVLYAMDRVANTCGHYDAYRKGVIFEKHIEFQELNLKTKAKYHNSFYNGDANTIITQKDFPKTDCVYCDPPYNSRNYSDLYHVLENVARWEKPEVEGVAKKMDRSALKSKYCGKKASIAFEDLVNKLDCKYIILSYNNTGVSANDRSNARMSDSDIMRILSQKGDVAVYSQKYKAFTTGKSENDSNEERLFVCTVRNNKAKEPTIVKSPLNYTGGKTKLLPSILPLFPKKIATFYDLFCGGGNVGANINSEKVIFNDSNPDVIELLKLFSSTPSSSLISKVDDIINKYGLSNTIEYGYDTYGCNSFKGLGSYNKDKYIQLRNDFNALDKNDCNYYTMLYTLIVFAFNNQMRFNSKGEFNLPVGKRDFNSNIRKHLVSFSEALKSLNKEFWNIDFRDLPIDSISSDDFVYCDPPYLITTAGYNEKDGWTEKDEKDLLALLDRLNTKKIKFALSNVLTHKGKKNIILEEWAGKYNIHKLSFNYINSSYHGKNTDKETQEVLITNF